MDERANPAAHEPLESVPRRGGAQPAPAPPRHRGRLTAALLVLVLVAGAGAVALALRRHRRVESERDRLAQLADVGPKVLVGRVTLAGGERVVTLPGDVRAFWQTTLFAKVNGYLAEIRVDKGDRVRGGQVLAKIASPETDHQVAEARSTLIVRRSLALRARVLAPKGIISQQELDQANADLQVAEAELRRVRALQEYEVLRAPFDGIVTARYVDPGALLPGSQTGQPVLDVADPTRLRVLMYVGQDAAPFVRVGDPGEISIDQNPDVHLVAHVSRTADALDPQSRSMLVELWVDNDGRLVPGIFVHVALHVRTPSFPTIPAEALVARGEQLQVALVQENKLHFVDVDPGPSDGRVTQIRHGLRGGEVVAISPPSDLGEGSPIQPLEARPQNAPGEGGPSGQRQGRAARGQ